MKQIRMTILVLFFAQALPAQNNDFDTRKINFNGLQLSTTKREIVKLFGQGKRVDTNYECGFFTNDQPGGVPYYQLVYTDFNYIGSDKDNFYLERVNFDQKGKIKIRYGSTELSGLTTWEEFLKIFGKQAKNNSDKEDSDSVLLISGSTDDGVRFTFRKGRLFRFQYWTPC
jgi:hypothetical protein